MRRMIEVERALNSNKMFLELLEKVVEVAKKERKEEMGKMREKIKRRW